MLLTQHCAGDKIEKNEMGWACGAYGEERGAYRVLVGKPEGRDYWGDLSVDGWIILGWISRRWDVGMWTGLGWHRIGTGGGRL
jgi:hypothetical protein